MSVETGSIGGGAGAPSVGGSSGGVEGGFSAGIAVASPAVSVESFSSPSPSFSFAETSPVSTGGMVDNTGFDISSLPELQVGPGPSLDTAVSKADLALTEPLHITEDGPANISSEALTMMPDFQPGEVHLDTTIPGTENVGDMDILWQKASEDINTKIAEVGNEEPVTETHTREIFEGNALLTEPLVVTEPLSMDYDRAVSLDDLQSGSWETIPAKVAPIEESSETTIEDLPALLDEVKQDVVDEIVVPGLTNEVTTTAVEEVAGDIKPESPALTVAQEAQLQQVVEQEVQEMFQEEPTLLQQPEETVRVEVPPIQEEQTIQEFIEEVSPQVVEVSKEQEVAEEAMETFLQEYEQTYNTSMENIAVGDEYLSIKGGVAPEVTQQLSEIAAKQVQEVTVQQAVQAASEQPQVVPDEVSHEVLKAAVVENIQVPLEQTQPQVLPIQLSKEAVAEIHQAMVVTELAEKAGFDKRVGLDAFHAKVQQRVGLSEELQAYIRQQEEEKVKKQKKQEKPSLRVGTVRVVTGNAVSEQVVEVVSQPISKTEIKRRVVVKAAPMPDELQDEQEDEEEKKKKKKQKEQEQVLPQVEKEEQEQEELEEAVEVKKKQEVMGPVKRDDRYREQIKKFQPVVIKQPVVFERDTHADENREAAALHAVKVIFQNRTSRTSPVTGADIVRNMPPASPIQPVPLMSDLVLKMRGRVKRDGSFIDVVENIAKNTTVYSENHARMLIKSAINASPAVREAAQVTSEKVGEKEVKRVLNDRVAKLFS